MQGKFFVVFSLFLRVCKRYMHLSDKYETLWYNALHYSTQNSRVYSNCPKTRVNINRRFQLADAFTSYQGNKSNGKPRSYLRTRQAWEVEMVHWMSVFICSLTWFEWVMQGTITLSDLKNIFCGMLTSIWRTSVHDDQPPSRWTELKSCKICQSLWNNSGLGTYLKNLHQCIVYNSVIISISALPSIGSEV